MARILVTGCSGYIGSRLVSRLRDAGHDVIGLDRSAAPTQCAGDFVRADLLEPHNYAHALERVDVVCHLAAAKGDWGISEAEYFRDNLDATRALIDAARAKGVKRWVFYSTVSALGPSAVALPEEAPRRPANPYGASKAACEELFEQYAEATSGAHVLMIRPSVVFGPGNPWNTNILRLVDAIYRNRFVMIGKGEEVKTTSYVENLLDAHMFLTSDGVCRASGVEVFHYLDEPGETTANLVRDIHACLGRRHNPLRLPLVLAAPLALVGDAAAAVTGIDLPITSARVRKFCTATNFSAQAIRRLGFRQRVANSEAIRVTVDWYLTHYLADSARTRTR